MNSFLRCKSCYNKTLLSVPSGINHKITLPSYLVYVLFSNSEQMYMFVVKDDNKVAEDPTNALYCFCYRSITFFVMNL